MHILISLQKHFIWCVYNLQLKDHKINLFFHLIVWLIKSNVDSLYLYYSGDLYGLDMSASGKMFFVDLNPRKRFLPSGLFFFPSNQSIAGTTYMMGPDEWKTQGTWQWPRINLYGKAGHPQQIKKQRKRIECLVYLILLNHLNQFIQYYKFPSNVK